MVIRFLGSFSTCWWSDTDLRVRQQLFGRQRMLHPGSHDHQIHHSFIMIHKHSSCKSLEAQKLGSCRERASERKAQRLSPPKDNQGILGPDLRKLQITSPLPNLPNALSIETKPCRLRLEDHQVRACVRSWCMYVHWASAFCLSQGLRSGSATRFS